MSKTFIKQQKKFYSWIGPEILKNIRDNEFVKKEYKDKIDFGIQALETKNDQLFEKSLPEDLFRDSYYVGYAWDVALPSYVLEKDRCCTKEKCKQDESQQVHSHVCEDNTDVEVIYEKDMVPPAMVFKNKRELVDVIVDCLGSSFLSSRGEPDDEVVLVQNINLNAKPIKISSEGDEITLVLKLDKEKIGICGIDNLDGVVVQVRSSNATPQNTFLSIGNVKE